MIRGEYMEAMRVKPGPQRLQAQVMAAGQCTACGMCAGLCPYIRFAGDRVRLVYPCGLEDGNCYRACPRTPYDLQELDIQVFGTAREDHLLGTHTGIYYARAARAVRPAAAQYGGVTTALVNFALEQGLIEGVLLVGGSLEQPLPMLATTPAGVNSCAGSKYLAVPSLANMLTARRTGLTHVGVVGRPCQVTAVRKIEGLTDNHELAPGPVPVLVIGLFCFWALDAGFPAFLTSRTRSRVTKMDITPVEVTVDTTAGPLSLSLDEVRPFIKPACHTCFDPTGELADVAIGSTEEVPGWNTLIVRSAKGESLVQEARAARVLEIRPYPGERLPLLREAAWRKKKRVLEALAGHQQPYLRLPVDYQLAIAGEEVIRDEYYARSS